MADPVTANIQLAVPTRGADPGKWDIPLNGDMNILDSAFGGVFAQPLGSANVVLSVAQAQSAVLRFFGTLTANATITLPAIVKFWTVENTTVGNFTVSMTTGAPGAKTIALPPGDADVFSDGFDVKFKNLGSVGEYTDYAGSSLPAWITACSVPPYLNCDGSAFSASTYPALAAILGTTTLPDLRGRARFCLNQGTGRITSAGSGINGDARFSSGGADGVVLTTAQIPVHAHGVSASSFDQGHSHGFGSGNSTSGATGAQPGNGLGPLINTGQTDVAQSNIGTSVSLANTGSDAAHTNMVPALISGITLIRAA